MLVRKVPVNIMKNSVKMFWSSKQQDILSDWIWWKVKDGRKVVSVGKDVEKFNACELLVGM